jgi:hypothetical protein
MSRWARIESHVRCLLKSKDYVHEKHEIEPTKLRLGFFVPFVFFVDKDFEFDLEELR